MIYSIAMLKKWISIGNYCAQFASYNFAPKLWKTLVLVADDMSNLSMSQSTSPDSSRSKPVVCRLSSGGKPQATSTPAFKKNSITGIQLMEGTFCGHVLHKDGSLISKEMLKYLVDNPRHRRRPKMRWNGGNMRRDICTVQYKKSSSNNLQVFGSLQGTRKRLYNG